MAAPMTRLLALLLLSSSLSACGIKGDLDRPAPLWGEPTADRVPDDNTAASSVNALDDPIDDPVTPFEGDPLEDEELEPDYGVDVAD